MKRPLRLHIYPHLALCVRSPALIPKIPATCVRSPAPDSQDTRDLVLLFSSLPLGETDTSVPVRVQEWAMGEESGEGR